MLLVKLIASPCRREIPCVSRRYLEAVYPAACEKFILGREQTVIINKEALVQSQHKRLIHTTHANRDLDAAIRTVAAGFAAIGVIGPGIGLGMIFGNMLQAIARNPSAAGKIFQFGILGAALCESIAFFALMISFIAMS